MQLLQDLRDLTLNLFCCFGCEGDDGEKMASGYNFVGVAPASGPSTPGKLIVLPTNEPVQLSASNGVVTSVTPGTGITVSPPGGQGPITISNGGVLAVSAGSNVTITGTAQNPIINAGAGGTVTSVTAGTGISVTGTSNAPIVNNSGVLALTSGSGITLTGPANSPTISNAGVTNVIAGSGISVSAASGTVTITNTTAASGVRTDGGLGDTSAGVNANPTFSVSGANTSYGYGTLQSITSGFGNTAVGVNAGEAYTTGQANVAIGSNSGATATTSSQNTSVGGQSLNLSTGHADTAIGAQSLASAGTGSYNTALGIFSGYTNRNGNYNTFLGAYTDNNLAADCTYSTAIGYGALIDGSNQLSIGSGTGGQGITEVAYSTGAAVASSMLQAKINGVNRVLPLGPELITLPGVSYTPGVVPSGYYAGGDAFTVTQGGQMYAEVTANAVRAFYTGLDLQITNGAGNVAFLLPLPSPMGTMQRNTPRFMQRLCAGWNGNYGPGSTTNYLPNTGACDVYWLPWDANTILCVCQVTTFGGSTPNFIIAPFVFTYWRF